MAHLYRIGVDGGGTTTRAVVIDAQTRALGRGEAGSSNHYSVGLERAAQNVVTAVKAALSAAGVDAAAVAGWGVALAGACTEAEQTLVHGHIAPLTSGLPVIVDEDQIASQMGAFGGGPGAVCGAGTGAYCFGVNDRGERARADGLGPLLGDRGSGYWIGEQTLRAICRANDGSGPATQLLPAVLQQLGLASVDELVQLVYRPDFERDRIAALVPTVIQCAGERDDVAVSLLRAAARELAATTRSVLQQLGIARVATMGGVLSHDSPVRPAYEEALRQSIPNVQIQEPLYDATIGAALLVGG
jgi:N-acetylglucosamine kinase-like BadF-type ATPase